MSTITNVSYYLILAGYAFVAPLWFIAHRFQANYWAERSCALSGFFKSTEVVSTAGMGLATALFCGYSLNIVDESTMFFTVSIISMTFGFIGLSANHVKTSVLCVLNAIIYAGIGSSYEFQHSTMPLLYIVIALGSGLLLFLLSVNAIFFVVENMQKKEKSKKEAEIIRYRKIYFQTH